MGLHQLASRLLKQYKRSRLSPDMRRWIDDEGDKILRVEYPLGNDATVFDLGGYRGDWAAEIVARYACDVHVFEPVLAFVERVRSRLGRNPKVHVHPFGLGHAAARVPLVLAEDGSTTSGRLSGSTIEIEIRAFADFLRDTGIGQVDLMKVNIEGAEYDLLEGMIGDGRIRSVQHLQVQFHPWFPDAAARYEKIRDGLSKTHRMTWRYPFIWENWQRID